MMQRRYDLDRLRVLGTGTIFVFHCLCIFSGPYFILMNPDLSPWALVLVSFMLLWMMPVFLIVSGMVTVYSLRVETGLSVVRGRVFRLVVPFVFGVFFLSPIIMYYSRLSSQAFSGSLVDFFLNGYFHGLQGFGGNFSFVGNHLWYLMYLFAFTVVVVMVLGMLPKKSTARLTERLGSFFARSGAIFLLSIPLILAVTLNYLEPVVLGQTATGGWNVAALFLFFCYGLLFAASPRFESVIDRHWTLSLILSLFLVPLYSWLVYTGQFLSLASWQKCVLLGFASFTSLLTVIGAFHKWAQRPSRRLERMNEGILPFYILHLPVIMIVGFYVIQLDLGILPKLGLIMGVSLPVIILLYLVIKRVRVLRFIFGMPPLKKQPHLSEQQPLKEE
jgi:glucan biosynthesis protein C